MLVQSSNKTVSCLDIAFAWFSHARLTGLFCGGVLVAVTHAVVVCGASGVTGAVASAGTGGVTAMAIIVVTTVVALQVVL